MEPVVVDRGIVRLAERRDAMRMAQIHVTAWQVGYVGQMPADHLASLDVEEFRGRWESYFAVAPARRAATALVAEDAAGRVAGIASFGEARDEPGTGELWMLNVDPDHWREGWGSALTSVAIEQLTLAGHGESVLWVVESNLRGRSFYEADGWRVDGANKIESIGSGQITEVRYRRRHRSDP